MKDFDIKNYQEEQIKLIEEQQKRNRNIFLASTVVSAFSAIIATAHFALGNELLAIQNIGVTIATGCYTIGYHHLYELNEIEKKKKRNELKSDTSPSTQLKNQLLKLKTTIERTKTYKNMNIVAGIGFSITSICNLLRCINPESGHHLVLTSLSACIAGVIAYLNFSMINNENTQIKNNEEEIELIESLIAEEQILTK